jgi:hypothetical protein
MRYTFEQKMKMLQEFYFRHGIIPTYREMAEMFKDENGKHQSTGSVFKFIERAEKEGYLEKVPVRLKPLNKFFL